MSLGALAPGTSTAPITRSASRTAFSIAYALEATVVMRAAELGVDLAQLGDVEVEDLRRGRPCRGRPAAALTPETPAPITTTSAG